VRADDRSTSLRHHLLRRGDIASWPPTVTAVSAPDAVSVAGCHRKHAIRLLTVSSELSGSM
jgi:hypothetical protein